jgi:hypothetical protein
MGMDEIVDGFVNDEETCYTNKTTFNRSRQEFCLPIAAGMFFVSGL